MTEEGSSYDGRVRSIFHNVLQDSLLIVMTYLEPHVTVSCRSCSMESIRRRAPDVQSLATDLDLEPPSFVEFDDLNGKLLIYCAFRQGYSSRSGLLFLYIHTGFHDS